MANRYWVGGVANWDGVAGTKWALTSGGPGGQAVPTSADDVFFDAASTNAATASITSTAVCKSLNLTGYQGSIAGSGTLTVSGNVTVVSSMVWSFTGTLIIDATSTFTSAGKNYAMDITFNSTGGTLTLADSLTLQGPKTFNLTAGTLDLNGNTLSTGIFSSSNSNTRSITFGSSNISLISTTPGTTILSMTTLNNFTWTGTGGFVRSANASASLSVGTFSGGTVSNAFNFSFNGGSSAITIGGWFNNLNFTGNSSTVTGSTELAGDLTLSATGTYTGYTPAFRDTLTITSNGKTLGNTVFNGSGATFTLADNFASNVLTFSQGTLNTGSANVTIASITSSGTSTRVLNLGSGTWTMTSSGATWGLSGTNLTVNSQTSTINCTSIGAKIFIGGGYTYYILNQGGPGDLTIQGSNTFDNLTNSVNGTIIKFVTGTTQTFSNFSLNNTNIQSSLAGSQYTLSKSSGTVNADRLTIQDSIATGGAVWNAYNSTNSGNNNGWIFLGGAFFSFF